MDALKSSALQLALYFAFGLALIQTASAQHYRAESKNFIVVAPDARLAQRAIDLSEQYRRDLSLDWLGYEIAPWREKCPIEIHVGPHAGGETSFAFVTGPNAKGEPISWQMKIYGPPDRLLDAVLPHEITHTIFATHFGRPLPRWADEGACTTVEHESERAKNHRMLISFLTSSPSRGIPFNRMFTMKQYPHDILPLYAQGYSVAKYLIGMKGRKHFIKFLESGMSNERSNFDTKTWDVATNEFYGFEDLSELQINWIGWVRDGSKQEPLAQLAKNEKSSPLVDPDSTYAVAKNNRKPDPDSTDVRRGDDTGRKLNSWYARQSRAKTAVDSDGNLKMIQRSSGQAGFLPGSVKRSRTVQSRSDLSSSDSNTGKQAPSTLWR